MSSEKLTMSAKATRTGSAEIEKLMQELQAAKTPENALKLARKAVELRPKNPDLRLMLAITLHNLGMAGEAEREYGECLMLDMTNLRALINLGSLQISGGQPQAGLKALDGALHLDPDNAEALEQKGRAFGIMGEPGKALKIFDQLVNRHPENVAFLKAQALCHMEIGHKTKAAEILFRAAELAPDDAVIKTTLKRVAS